MKETQLITVLVGSHAHDLATASSDKDYRGVHAVRTRSLLAVGHEKPKETKWIEGATQDDVSWELARFLQLAIHCDPNVIETFVAPTTYTGPWSRGLQKLLPAVTSKRLVKEAFCGYATNRLRRLLDWNLPDDQRRKGALAAIRTLMNGLDLMKTGTFPVSRKGTNDFDLLRRIRDGDSLTGDIMSIADTYVDALSKSMSNSPLRDDPDLEVVNQYVEMVRAACW